MNRRARPGISDVGAAIGLAVAWVALCLILGLGLRLAVELLLIAFASAAP